MIAVVQRVSFARLSIGGSLYSEIGAGLMVLLGVAREDTSTQADWLARKVAQLRIIADKGGKMNRSVLDSDGEVMVVSQFTLLADASQGNRPSYIKAASPETAIPLYEGFVRSLEEILGRKVRTGVFAADMQIELLNDGPVTLVLDTAVRMKKS